LFTLVSSVMIAAAVPAAALAHGRHHHHHHQVRVHHRDFGHVNDMAGDAGTVASFDSATGKLTIALNDGSTVTGTVTPDTEIECEAANEPEHDNFFHKNDHGSGSGDQGGSGDQSGSGDQGDRGDDNNRGDDNDNNDNAMQNCDTSALTTGATVHEAELRLSGNGAIWDRVELAAPAGSSSMDS
jgi:hypothetical protein